MITGFNELNNRHKKYLKIVKEASSKSKGNNERSEKYVLVALIIFVTAMHIHKAANKEKQTINTAMLSH
jgi:hypothetical protein